MYQFLTISSLLLREISCRWSSTTATSNLTTLTSKPRTVQIELSVIIPSLPPPLHLPYNPPLWHMPLLALPTLALASILTRYVCGLACLVGILGWMNFRCSVLAFAYLENRLSNLLGNTSSHNFDKKKIRQNCGNGGDDAKHLPFLRWSTDSRKLVFNWNFGH